MSPSLAERLARFGVVGFAAVVTQALVFYVAATHFGISGLAANTCGFLISLPISYWGQSRWTFSDHTTRSTPRFLVIAVVSFVIGSVGSWLVVDHGKLAPVWVLPIILLAIPGASFVLMRSWAFTRDA